MQPDRDQILEDIRQQWDALMGLVDSVPRPRMEDPKAVDEWSIKDILGHILTWDAEVMAEIRHVRTGGAPFQRPDDFNDAKAAELRGLPLSETLANLKQTHDDCVAYLASLPEEAFAIDRVRSLAQGCAAHHYAEHAEDIEGWLREPVAGAGRDRRAVS